MHALFMILLFVLAVALIVLILVQRGKGGGLAGAFGGMGGQSAFGTKAGDTFTRITIGVAAVWILACIVGVRMLSEGPGRLDLQGDDGARSTGAADDIEPLPGAPADDGGTPADNATDATPAAPADATPVPADKPAGDEPQ